MTPQTLKNHARIVVGYHIVTLLALLALFIGSIVNLIGSSGANTYSASLLVLMSVIGFMLWFFIRSFALKAQDRAIKAEESFRYYLLTGKPLPHQITISQIVGLRFASDQEFPNLVNQALSKNLSQKEIKQAITNWKPDHYRV